MSEARLPRDGEPAAENFAPSEAEERALSGSVRLLQAALASPLPPAQAETQSRQRVLELWRDPALAPRALHETRYADASSPLARFWIRVRRLWGR